jgi:hypothetical protein
MGFFDWFFGDDDDDENEEEESVPVDSQDVDVIDGMLHDEEFDDYIPMLQKSHPGAYDADDLDIESPGGPDTDELPAVQWWNPFTWR